MAEDLDEADGEVEAEAPAEQASAAAIALALGRAGKADKGFDKDARAFLRRQTRLIELQTEHLHEQRLLQLSHMRWRRFSDRMKALLQVMTAVVGLAIAAGVGGMAFMAANEHGLVIEPFSVPPDLAQRGLTGQVVASLLLDRLGDMQNVTVSVRAPSTYANDWNGDVKVEIPETGVSVRELYRLFVRWLGHQTSISGELYRTPTGIALSARTGTAPAKTHAGSEADLDAMIQSAAEDVYATTQPYRYAIYLERGKDAGALARATAALTQLSQSSDRTDRIWALAGLNLALSKQGDVAGAIRATSAAIAIEPRFALPYANQGSVEQLIGHDEAALADARKALLTVRSDGVRFMKPSALVYVTPSWESVVDYSLGDFQRASQVYAAALPEDPSAEADRFQLGYDQALAHDLLAAKATQALIQSPAPSDTNQNAAQTRWRLAELAAEIALQREDWPEVRRLLAGIDRRSLLPGDLMNLQTNDAPLLALARAKLGDVADADAMGSATPPDNYEWIRMRGQIAALRRDWPVADGWFAEATRQAPSIPFAFTEWGAALLAKGDPDAAIGKFELAHQKGPNFADPMELWGEALMRKGDFAGAAARFADADRDAPSWGRNHLRWGEALLHLGNAREARAQFQTAGRLDLSVRDRAALNVFLARTGAVHG